MATQRITLESTAVDKMFPVSFEREGKYDRVLSEENLTSWIRGLLPNSADDSKNSPSSYMITPVIPDNFAQSNSDGKSEYIEFIIGGYYDFRCNKLQRTGTRTRRYTLAKRVLQRTRNSR